MPGVPRLDPIVIPDEGPGIHRLGRAFPMATAREIRSLIEQTTTGTRRRRVPEEVKEQVRRYAERRRTQGSSWEATVIRGDREADTRNPSTVID